MDEKAELIHILVLNPLIQEMSRIFRAFHPYTSDLEAVIGNNTSSGYSLVQHRARNDVGAC